MKTTALIEKGKDGTFGIFTPDIQATIIGEGRTVAEAKADFENSVREMFASYTENGEELPAELQGIEFEYKYDVASVFDYFDFINVTKFAKWAGINAGLMQYLYIRSASAQDRTGAAQNRTRIIRHFTVMLY